MSFIEIVFIVLLHVYRNFRALFQVIGMIGRVQFFVMGFMWITVKGKRASNDEARILVIAPHSSFFDALTWFSSFPMASSVSRVENIKAPFIGCE